MADLYIGLMSGTSMDSIDAALVELDDSSAKVLQTAGYPYPADLRERLLAAISIPVDQEIQNIAELDQAIGECFREAALSLLVRADVSTKEITAIGSHGQTVRHQPDADIPFTLQVGDPNIIASGTGITTIADFRSADIAAGGQGAPLAPFFHEWLFRPHGVHRAVLSIGGIANVTLLSEDAATVGFDTGPGNTLMDAWIRKHHNAPFDRNGEWANSGTVNTDLLGRFMSDPYFAAAPPKSTGFEAFNLRWIETADSNGIDPADVQATLCQLTALTAADAIATFAAQTSEVLVCGGGVHNFALMERLRNSLNSMTVDSTATAGLDPDWVEAAAFAWLAMRRMHGLPGNLPRVTGAREAVQLGSIHLPS